MERVVVSRDVQSRSVKAGKVSGGDGPLRGSSMESEFLECMRNPGLLQSAFAMDWGMMSQADMTSINMAAAAAAAAARVNVASSGGGAGPGYGMAHGHSPPAYEIDDFGVCGEDICDDEHEGNEADDFVDEEDEMDSAHGDAESSCSMCRRCQLRRRLERKLAARKMLCMLDELENHPDRAVDMCDAALLLENRHLSSSAERSCSLPARATNGISAAPVEDKRSIDDLLSFIGEKPQDGKAKRKSKPKKKKNKSKNVSGHCHGDAELVDKTILVSSPCTQSLICGEECDKADWNGRVAQSETGCIPESSTCVGINRQIDDHHVDKEGKMPAESDLMGNSELLDAALESLFRMDREIEEDIRFDDITPEEHAALDREVEEFRIRLERHVLG